MFEALGAPFVRLMAASPKIEHQAFIKRPRPMAAAIWGGLLMCKLAAMALISPGVGGELFAVTLVTGIAVTTPGSGPSGRRPSKHYRPAPLPGPTTRWIPRAQNRGPAVRPRSTQFRGTGRSRRACDRPEIAVTGRPYPGGPIEIEGTDFEEGELVTLELRKEGQAPVLLGSVPVEAGGTFAVTLHVPAEVRPGLYELLASVEDESTSAKVTLLDPPDGSGEEAPGSEVQDISNDRPSAEKASLGIVTALLAAGGAGIILAGRRRPVQPLQR